MFYCQIRTTRTFWSWPVFGVYLICTHLANALFHMDFNLKISWMLEIKLCKSVCNKWLKVCLNNFRYTEVILLQAYGNLRWNKFCFEGCEFQMFWKIPFASNEWRRDQSCFFPTLGTSGITVLSFQVWQKEDSRVGITDQRKNLFLIETN